MAILRLNIGDLTMRKLNLIYMEDLIRGYLVTGKLSSEQTLRMLKLNCDVANIFVRQRHIQKFP